MYAPVADVVAPALPGKGESRPAKPTRTPATGACVLRSMTVPETVPLAAPGEGGSEKSATGFTSALSSEPAK